MLRDKLNIVFRGFDQITVENIGLLTLLNILKKNKIGR